VECEQGQVSNDISHGDKCQKQKQRDSIGIGTFVEASWVLVDFGVEGEVEEIGDNRLNLLTS
jgi:hypothetical protein